MCAALTHVINVIYTSPAFVVSGVFSIGYEANVRCRELSAHDWISCKTKWSSASVASDCYKSVHTVRIKVNALTACVLSTRTALQRHISAVFH